MIGRVFNWLWTFLFCPSGGHIQIEDVRVIHRGDIQFRASAPYWIREDGKRFDDYPTG